MKKDDDKGTTTLSVSMVTQGKTKFFTLTMPIEVLAECATVETRTINPIEGFQRHLDERRAEEIARYVDEGNSIPNSIVLSAQAASNLKYTRAKRSITFTRTRASFFIVDGQHRVFGFSKAKTKTLRVPVVIYDGLTRAQECKLFIDINTKQRPVPNALLLDIKGLAEAETDEESLLRDIFDRFDTDASSPLFGYMSAAESKAGAISRVTFNAAVKSIFHVFDDKDLEGVFEPLSAYLAAWRAILRRNDASDLLLKPTVFKAIIQLFPDVAERVAARSEEYLVPNFEAVMTALDSAKTPKLFAKHGGKFRDLHELLKTELTKGFRVRSK
ncbi:MAG TPA: DGQHR domain-containing protein [Kofleriaceae bacterium]|nr:DGQHR domain-containing protein [Kofleriaceae bacterium]